MTWSLAGWLLIGLSAILLIVFHFLFQGDKGYSGRRFPETEALMDSRVFAIEKGQRQQIVLGHHFWSRAYPGLGLHALSVLPSLVDAETGADGGLTVSAGDGSLVVFARQIVQAAYQDGFSSALRPAGVKVTLPGPTPLSFTAGLLPELGRHSHGSLALFGNYGVEAALWAETAVLKGSQVFSAASTLDSQAVLYMNVPNLLIGEEVFMLPGLLTAAADNEAGWLTEDILRSLLMLLLVIAAILKMVGVL